MSGFTKIWSDMLTSSVWETDPTTKVVWITILCMKDGDGIVRASVSGIAHQARVTIEDCTKAVSVLSSPDPDSRTPDCDGRRIVKVDGGYFVINAEKYQWRRDPNERKTYLRNYMRDYMKVKRTGETSLDNVKHVKQCYTPLDSVKQCYTGQNGSSRNLREKSEEKHASPREEVPEKSDLALDLLDNVKPCYTQLESESYKEEKEIIKKKKPSATPAGNQTKSSGTLEEWIQELKPLYPRLDVDGEFRRARSWLLVNPARKGTKKFFVAWLIRADSQLIPGLEEGKRIKQEENRRVPAEDWLDIIKACRQDAKHRNGNGKTDNGTEG